jgi:hypothetical protein
MEWIEMLKTGFEECKVDEQHSFYPISEALCNLNALLNSWHDSGEYDANTRKEAQDIRDAVEEMLGYVEDSVLGYAVSEIREDTGTLHKVSIQELLVTIIMQSIEVGVDKNAYKSVRVEDLADVVDAEMAIVPEKSILSYTAFDVFNNAIPVFLSKMMYVACYKEEYFKYWQLVEFRAYELIMRVGTSKLEYNHELFCEEIVSDSGALAYVMNIECVREMVVLIKKVREHFSSHIVFEHVAPEYSVTAEQHERLRKFLSDQSIKMTDMKACAKLGVEYIGRCVYIGERDMYKRLYPEEIYTDTSVIKKTRSAGEFEMITSTAYPRKFDCAIIEGLKIEPEPMYVRCAITLLLNKYFYARMGFYWEEFLIEESNLRNAYEECVIEEYPKIIETFSRHQLLYKERAHEHNSYMNAFIHWLYIIQTEFDGEVEGRNIRALILEIMGSEFIATTTTTTTTRKQQRRDDGDEEEGEEGAEKRYRLD